jgi:hypothetical protein
MTEKNRIILISCRLIKPLRTELQAVFPAGAEGQIPTYGIATGDSDEIESRDAGANQQLSFIKSAFICINQHDLLQMSRLK